MFTGIVECTGKVVEIRESGTNRHFGIESPISGELKVDQSVSHEGVCLTVTHLEPGKHWVTAIAETLDKSNLSAWKLDKKVNLERCMKVDGRFDGHIVQGHVDGVAEVLDIRAMDGSWLFSFRSASTQLIVEKGSVCINGTSLTCFGVSDHEFSVAIIPYTYEHTTFCDLKKGDQVNIEFDIIGKYVQKLMMDRT